MRGGRPEYFANVAFADHRLQFITSGTGVIDNVQVTTFADTGNGGGGSVPEPATPALLSLGLAGLIASRWRNRN